MDSELLAGETARQSGLLIESRGNDNKLVDSAHQRLPQTLEFLAATAAKH
eukprot:m.27832 g.27832  ORF g.27832 m.27832 type:complete len:50 (+) comp8650_c0_seq1:199-348(+)